ncbi:tyrosine-protein kinase family protein [Flavivirga rizhaonensis]|uniref:AAA domain-containing protein n=1 Tax=Flavivirga rizhaonensis TaxID=2559571 RepID=A0A4S1DXG1_9FLAO|nr:AAA family ATPase [Flavivirga rizhaonensis]TGV02759.1 hypothetical protein EM932_10030 [Flavivirga rizhaonensis]
MESSINLVVNTLSKIRFSRNKVFHFLSKNAKLWKLYTIVILVFLVFCHYKINNEGLIYRYSSSFQIKSALDINSLDNLLNNYIPNSKNFEEISFTNFKASSLSKKIINNNNLFIQSYKSKYSYHLGEPLELNSIFGITINSDAFQLIDTKIYLKQTSTDSIRITISFDEDVLSQYNYQNNISRDLDIAVNDTTFNVKIGKRVQNKYFDFTINKMQSLNQDINYYFKFKDLNKLSDEYNSLIKVWNESENFYISCEGKHYLNIKKYIDELTKGYLKYHEDEIKLKISELTSNLSKSNKALEDSLSIHLKKEKGHFHQLIIDNINQKYDENLRLLFKANQLKKRNLFSLRTISSKISPVENKRFYYALYMFAGISIVFIYANLFFLASNFLNRSINSIIKVKKVIGKNTFFVLPKMSRKIKNKIFCDSSSFFSQRFEYISTYLTIEKPNCKTILFTSTLQGEGKTTSSLKLATYLTQLGYKTVFLSLDLRKHNPLINKLKNKEYLGFLDYMDDQTLTSKDIIVNFEVSECDNDISKLDVILPNGTSQNSHILLSSDRLKALIIELKNLYDYVIIDTLPVGLFSESRFIFNQIDLIFYLIRFDYSNYQFTKFSIEDSLSKNEEVLFLINDMKEDYIYLNGIASRQFYKRGYFAKKH